MGEGNLLMSCSERDRAHVVRQVIEHRLGQREASERLGIGVRTGGYDAVRSCIQGSRTGPSAQTLVLCWKHQGDAGLVSRQRGRASHNRLLRHCGRRSRQFYGRNTRHHVATATTPMLL
jgi:hypothetical protein